jgi:Domain of unknown function (DUF5664)
MSSGGRKEDNGKLRMDLIPGYPLMRLAEVYTIGANKYNDDNWRKGISYKRIFAAMLRHAWKWFMGEQFDPDGQHHLSSVAWAAFTLMEYEVTHPEFDDRPKEVANHNDMDNKKSPSLEGAEQTAEDMAITNAKRALGYKLPGSSRLDSRGAAPCGQDVSGPFEGGQFSWTYPTSWYAQDSGRNKIRELYS